MFKKIKTLKLLTTLALSFTLVLANMSSAHATMKGEESIGEATLQSTNDYNRKTTLSISSSGVAKINANISGSSSISKIAMTVKLQKYNKSTDTWKKVKSWDKTSSSYSISFSKSYDLTLKGTYRCKITADVTSGGSVETIKFTSSKQVYS